MRLPRHPSAAAMCREDCVRRRLGSRDCNTRRFHGQPRPPCLQTIHRYKENKKEKDKQYIGTTRIRRRETDKIKLTDVVIYPYWEDLHQNEAFVSRTHNECPGQGL